MIGRITLVLTLLLAFCSLSRVVEAQVIVATAAALTSETCTPANGAIDPQEFTTVSLWVQNLGDTDTQPLVGTLEVSGGVLLPGAPQYYGVLSASGPSVCRDYSFIADRLDCGTTLTATLNLSDGKNNLGSVQYNFPMGLNGECCQPACDVTCPNDIVVSTTQSNCGAYVSYFPGPLSGDPCGAITFNPPSGSFFPVGTTTVVCSSANGGVCTFKVTVHDALPLPIYGPPNDQIGNSAYNIGTCGYFVKLSDYYSTVDCPSVTLKFDPPDGSFFSVGTTTGTVTASDDVDHVTTRVFTVVMLDQTKPGITIPGPITVPNDPGQCGAIVHFVTPTAFDNCQLVSFVISPNYKSGDFFPTGTYDISCTAKDNSGNVNVRTFRITVRDMQNPVITCPANITTATVNFATQMIVSFPLPTVTDNCPGWGTPYYYLPSGYLFGLGTSKVDGIVYDANDHTGNMARYSTCSFNVTVYDAVLQDDSNPRHYMFLNTTTGEFSYGCDGNTFTGTATVKLRQGCKYSINFRTSQQTLTASIDKCRHSGTANLRMGRSSCRINDANTLNDNPSVP